MKDVEHEPPPPFEEAGASDELLQVMRALGREAPSRAALERVARGLGPVLDAAPGAIAVQQVVRSTSTKLLVARAVAALLAIGGTAYWLVKSEIQVPPTPRAPISVQAPTVVAPVAPEPVVEPAPVIAEPLSVEQPVKRVRHTHHRTRVTAAVAAPVVLTPPTAEAPVEVAPTVQAEPQLAVAPEPKPQQVREEPPRQLDEFTMLYQARERMRRDPAGALVILDQHAAVYANGQLAPEREVLAVEVLRALGHKQEAERRLAAFRERYPGSIHLRRLQRTAD